MSAATLVRTYIDVTGLAFSGDAAFGAGLGQFVTEIELGRLWLLQLMLAAMTTVLCFAVRDRRWVLLALVGEVLLIEPASAWDGSQGRRIIIGFFPCWPKVSGSGSCYLAG